MEEKAIFGDYQTPDPLALSVCLRLRALGLDPALIVEPTCGKGGFLIAAATTWPDAELLGLEINADYLAVAAQRLKAGGCSKFELVQQDFFKQDWPRLLSAATDNTLILGNPPWVTSAALSESGSNLPEKSNFQGLSGLAAKTGKANFDIAEWMLIRLIEAATGKNLTIAMLCKTATARKVLRDRWLRAQDVASAQIFDIDASAHFNVSVGACLLIVKLGAHKNAEASLYDSLESVRPARRLGLAGKQLVADLGVYLKLRHLEGYSPFVWRSGIKHDCSAVMELDINQNGALQNGAHELVAIEPDYLYPLLKSTDVSKGNTVPRKAVLITQRSLGEDTASIDRLAPRTWAYLNAHASRLASRRSSIYRNRPSFSIFGIGPYAFAPWKLAISGMHQKIRFVVVPPSSGKPMMLDDTCYYLPFDSRSQAEAAAQILNSDTAREFMQSLVFLDSKRPITSELLQRISLMAVAKQAGLDAAWDALNGSTFENRREQPSQAALAMEPSPPAYEPGPR